MPNRLYRFWHELKRRNVIKVATMYAATAFIIIEAADIILPRLGLPDWTVTLVIILLIAGFPVTAILSWIFDVTPDGIRKTEADMDDAVSPHEKQKSRRGLRISDVVIIILLAAVCVLVYPKIFSPDKFRDTGHSDGRKSIVVMPFQNLTNDTVWNIWQDGIQNEVITSLTNADEIKVRQYDNVNNVLQSKGLTNYASITPSIASTISKNLNSDIFIYGSLKKAGSVIRLNAQLIDVATKDIFQSYQIDGSADHILDMTDSLSNMIRNFLVLSTLEKELPVYVQNLQDFQNTNSSEAYRYYLYGETARKDRDYPTAMYMFTQALAIDTTFTLAKFKLSVVYMNQGLYPEAKDWLLRAYSEIDRAPLRLRILINKNYAFFFETPVEQLKYLRQLLQIDDYYPGTYYDIGLRYTMLNQYDQAIPEFEKSLEIYDQLDSKPWWVYNYSLLGEAYHKTGQYKKEKKIYKKADRDFPEDPLIIYQKAILALTMGDTVKANQFIERYMSASKEDPSSEEFVTIGPAQFYLEAGKPELAEEYFRDAYSSEPDNVYRMYDLAWFLIDNGRDIEEGLELIDKALELRPDLKWFLLDGKGWGLYQQGKYREALRVLQECWDSRIYYEHSVYLHLEAAKEAVTG